MIVFVAIIIAVAAAVAYYLNDWWVLLWVSIAAIIYAVIQYFVAGSVATMMAGANEIEKKDNPRLYNVVENLSITTGLPMPKV